MRLLMRQYILPLHLVQTGGQIDAWFYNAEDKRRGNGIAKINVILNGERYTHAPTQPKITHERIEQHGSKADEPHPACDLRPDIERVDAGCWHGGKMLAERGIHSIVDNAHAAGDGRRGGKLHGCRTDRFGTGNQAQRALYGEWQNQPQSDNTPEQDIHPLGRTL